MVDNWITGHGMQTRRTQVWAFLSAITCKNKVGAGSFQGLCKRYGGNQLSLTETWGWIATLVAATTTTSVWGPYYKFQTHVHEFQECRFNHKDWRRLRCPDNIICQSYTRCRKFVCTWWRHRPHLIIYSNLNGWLAIDRWTGPGLVGWWRGSASLVPRPPG